MRVLVIYLLLGFAIGSSLSGHLLNDKTYSIIGLVCLVIATILFFIKEWSDIKRK
jgi:uncharacterized membrane protein YfcA